MIRDKGISQLLCVFINLSRIFSDLLSLERHCFDQRVPIPMLCLISECPVCSISIHISVKADRPPSVSGHGIELTGIYPSLLAF